MARTKKHIRKDNRLILEEMEPRRLFSGGIEGLVDLDPQQQDNAVYLDLDAHREPDAAGGEQAAAAEQQSREIVFVDAAVKGYEQIVNDLNHNADADRNIEVLVLDRDRNGIDQISSFLQDRDQIDAVHIISHGKDGNIQLGNTALNTASLLQNQTSISAWADAFTDSGDILIYGCNLAASDAGMMLVDSLGQLTDRTGVR